MLVNKNGNYVTKGRNFFLIFVLMHVQIIYVARKTRHGTVPNIYYTIRWCGYNNRIIRTRNNYIIFLYHTGRKKPIQPYVYAEMVVFPPVRCFCTLSENFGSKRITEKLPRFRQTIIKKISSYKKCSRRLNGNYFAYGRRRR